MELNCYELDYFVLESHLSSAQRSCAVLAQSRIAIKNYFLHNEVVQWSQTNMNTSRIFFNGELIGHHDNPEELVENIRDVRRCGIISKQLNITYYPKTNEVVISTDSGRTRRPLIIAENGRSLVTEQHIQDINNGKLTFEDLVNEGLVEYVDAEEEENTLVAINEQDLTEQHTHLEVNPALILGICTGMVPFPEHNASPRNTMGAGMMKQSLGVSSANLKLRQDTRAHM
ncbi:MAG: DNA-directed RNA polymerase subunit B', partial [Candidatus Argoarchaeum ethanivorans]